MPETVIKVENISKKYHIGNYTSSSLRETIVNKWDILIRKKKNEGEEFWALNDISFEVKKGEILGIIGKNGAGKSTLLKILSRITEPTSGKIKINGRVSSLLEVGTGFHPELTGRENIFLNGTILGMTRKEVKSKFNDIVEFSGVEKFIDTPVKHYSSGMYVRLAFAVAAFLEPEILIIDEVLAVGDADFQKKCIGKMEDVVGKGRTILFVSHNMSAIQTLCKTGVLLLDGKVQKIGLIQDVVSQYKNNTIAITNNIKAGKGIFDLTNHKNKKHNENDCMKRVLIYCNNELSDVFFGGCTFRFDIEVENPLIYDNLLYGFVIKNGEGEPLIGINNRHTGDKFYVNQGKKLIFKTEISKFPIYREGFYTVDLYWGNHNTSHEIIFDAFSFEVERTDVFNTANVIESKLNLIYTERIDFKLV